MSSISVRKIYAITWQKYFLIILGCYMLGAQGKFLSIFWGCFWGTWMSIRGLSTKILSLPSTENKILSALHPLQNRKELGTSPIAILGGTQTLKATFIHQDIYKSNCSRAIQWEPTHALESHCSLISESLILCIILIDHQIEKIMGQCPDNGENSRSHLTIYTQFHGQKISKTIDEGSKQPSR